MDTYMMLANVGELLKVTAFNTDKPLSSVSDMEHSNTPVFTVHDTPLGKCKSYRLSDLTVFTIGNNVFVEVLDGEIRAEINFKYDPESIEFRHAAYIVPCFIIGHVVGESDALYKTFVTAYLENIIINKYNTSIDFEEYNRFIKVEEEVLNIKDHVTMQDILFQRNMSTYFNKTQALDISVIDITDCKNIFKTKKIFYV